MTVCDDCELIAVHPILSPAEETARVLAHGQHLGGDVETMTGAGDLA
jgi:hypothetical protein